MIEPGSTTNARPIPVRAPRFALDELGRGWLATDPVASDVVDALSMIFPEGERFFIRSVQAFADRYEQDPELRARVRGFIGQEGRHGHEHDRMNKALAARGHDLATYDRYYRMIMYSVVERATPKHLRLASTVALEHMTATLAEIALTTDVLDDAPPEVARLLRWHALEEVEHRSVAFDVLAKVDPRLRTRTIGLAIGIATLLGAWGAAFTMLRFDDRGNDKTPRDAKASRRFWRNVDRATPRVLRSLRRYLDRDFHPERAIDEKVVRECAAVLEQLAAA
jgi:predicted metal-dependent hydrolase